MKRVAALYDIHANLPALEAVLEDVRAARVDGIVVGGDVLPGPMPHEALERLLGLDLPVQFIYGNGEVAVLESLSGRELSATPEAYRQTIAWTAEHVREYRDVLAGWPLTIRVDVEGIGSVLFCHATPRNDNECFTRLTPEDRLRPIFDGLGAPVVVCGHTHMQFDRTIGGTRVLNAGSVGTPFGDPGADWLLLGSGVEFRHSDYDLASAADRIRATSMPWPDDFAARYVVEPPSAAEMLDLFTRASL
jgi:predicted phosphodiesterase